MNDQLIIPDECVRYIRWQRSRFIAYKQPDPNQVKKKYAAWIAEDFATMEPHLPERVDTILDIGCGMAALDVHLKRRYPNAHLSLLDGTGENLMNAGTPKESGVGGWNATLAPYNSREHTEMLLAANGVSVDRWIDIGTKELLEADLIVSLSSLGFHYPLNTYRLRGFCIIDLRRGTEPQRGKVIFVGPKYDRCAFTMDDA